MDNYVHEITYIVPTDLSTGMTSFPPCNYNTVAVSGRIFYSGCLSRLCKCNDWIIPSHEPLFAESPFCDVITAIIIIYDIVEERVVELEYHIIVAAYNVGSTRELKRLVFKTPGLWMLGGWLIQCGEGPV